MREVILRYHGHQKVVEIDTPGCNDAIQDEGVNFTVRQVVHRSRRQPLVELDAVDERHHLHLMRDGEMAGYLSERGWVKVP